jgi:acetyl esterase/lipase
VQQVPTDRIVGKKHLRFRSGRRGALAFGLVLALLAGCATAVLDDHPALTFRNPTAGEATTWLPEAQPDRRIRYADDSPVQYADLRLPAGRPSATGHPVAVVIHGGAWHADWTSDYTAPLAEALTKAGIATWNIEFRRLGNRGGGYPGTFTDVGSATDLLHTLAQTYPLDLSRVVVVGHSSGGHLALWLAGRRKLPAGSGLRGRDPLPLAGAISLAGVNDLEAALALGGRTDVLDLVGAGAAAAGPRFAMTSPGRLLPLGVPQVLIVGTRDEPWRIEMTRRYASAAAEAGDDVELRVLEGANHADVVDPHGPAPAMIARAVQSLVSPEQRSRPSHAR